MALFRTMLCGLALLTLVGPVSADWFLSTETKALIVKAEAGDASAQFRVGSAYDSGKGAPHDAKEALKWYQMAAEQGNAEAQNSVGSLLQADKKYAEALPWFEKASLQDHALATNNLAYLYDLGLGVPQDRKKGFELYSKAADLGWAEAMWNLANMYGAGQVGPVDYVMACAWARRAQHFATVDQRKVLAYVNRAMPQIERLLDSDGLASCTQKADAWSPKTSAKP